MQTPALAVLVAFIAIVLILLGISRYSVTKLPHSSRWSYLNIKSPDQETDGVPDNIIYLLCVIVMMEGTAFALYPTACAGRSFEVLTDGGYNSFQTMSQILSFSAITLLGLQAIIRPANRLDPLRTILEVFIISLS
jgi:hypothetical protein